MAKEFIYTSAPRGVRPGSSGYCGVVSTQGLTPEDEELFGRLSEFNLSASGQAESQSPNVSHVRVRRAQSSSSVLFRTCAAGLDYSNRLRKLSHFYLLDDRDLESAEAGPGWLASHTNLFVDDWHGDPKINPQDTGLPTGSYAPAPCQTWAQWTGDAGWGGVLAEQAADLRARPLLIIYPAGADVLPLILESSALLGSADRWFATFATNYVSVPEGVDCRWRFVPHDSPALAKLKNEHAGSILDLTQPVGLPHDSAAIAAARAGTLLMSQAMPNFQSAAAPQAEPAPAEPGHHDASAADEVALEPHPSEPNPIAQTQIEPAPSMFADAAESVNDSFDAVAGGQSASVPGHDPRWNGGPNEAAPPPPPPPAASDPAKQKAGLFLMIGAASLFGLLIVTVTAVFMSGGRDGGGGGDSGGGGGVAEAGGNGTDPDETTQTGGGANSNGGGGQGQQGTGQQGQLTPGHLTPGHVTPGQGNPTQGHGGVGGNSQIGPDRQNPRQGNGPPRPDPNRGREGDDPRGDQDQPEVQHKPWRGLARGIFNFIIGQRQDTIARNNDRDDSPPRGNGGDRTPKPELAELGKALDEAFDRGRDVRQFQRRSNVHPVYGSPESKRYEVLRIDSEETNSTNLGVDIVPLLDKVNLRFRVRQINDSGDSIRIGERHAETGQWPIELRDRIIGFLELNGPDLNFVWHRRINSQMIDDFLRAAQYAAIEISAESQSSGEAIPGFRRQFQMLMPWRYKRKGIYLGAWPMTKAQPWLEDIELDARRRPHVLDVFSILKGERSNEFAVDSHAEIFTTFSIDGQPLDDRMPWPTMEMIKVRFDSDTYTMDIRFRFRASAMPSAEDGEVISESLKDYYDRVTRNAADGDLSPAMINYWATIRSAFDMNTLVLPLDVVFAYPFESEDRQPLELLLVAPDPME